MAEWEKRANTRQALDQRQQPFAFGGLLLVLPPLLFGAMRVVPECGCFRAMHTAFALNPALRAFRNAPAELYGPDFDRVVLFGSRARGDARADSDYDVAVFLSDRLDRREEWDRLAELRVRFLLTPLPAPEP